MNLSRRFVLTVVGGLALPGPAAAWPFRRRPRAPEGRAAYAGAPLRAQLGAWEFDAARQAGLSRLQPVIRDGLEARFDETRAGMAGVTAITAALVVPDGSAWTHAWAAGDPPPRFPWPGLAEAYIATAAMQMVEEGALALDAPLARWAPDAPNAAHITIEDLLAHTSGLALVPPEDGAAQGQPLVDRALQQPGAAWSFSEAGYARLADILQAVDGRPAHEVLTNRIVQRRELAETVIPAPQQAPEGPDAHGVRELAASAMDVARFWRALLADQLHGPEATRRRFERLYPTPQVAGGHYGLGVMVVDRAAADANGHDTWLGHAGTTAGARAMAAYSTRTQAFVAVALTGEGSPEAMADQLLDALVQA